MLKDNLERKKKFWDLMSNEFLNTLKKKEASKETNNVIEYLKSKKILNNNSKVLDIGCGIGRYSIPMAKHVEKVIAIDISSEMIKLGKELAASNGISNIEWIETPFENISYGDKEFVERFDLVFAYNSGAIIDDNSIKKLIKFTNKAFYINGFLKRKHYFLELTREFFFKNIVAEDIGEKIALENLIKFIKEKKFKNEISTRNEIMEKTFSLEKISQLYSQYLSEDDESSLKNNKVIYDFLKPYSKNNEIIEKTEIEKVIIYCEINNNIS